MLSAVSRRHGIFPNHHVSSDSASHPETPSGGAQADCLPGRPFICLSPRPLKKAAFAPDYGQLWGKPPAPASEVPPLLSAIQGCLTFQAGGAFLTQRRSPGSQGTCGCPWLCSGPQFCRPAPLGQHLPYKPLCHLNHMACWLRVWNSPSLLMLVQTSSHPRACDPGCGIPARLCKPPTPRAPAEARGAASTTRQLALTPDARFLLVAYRPGLCHPWVLPATPEVPTAIHISQVKLRKPRNAAAWPRATKPLRGTDRTSPLPHPPSCADPSDKLINLKHLANTLQREESPSEH